MTGKNSNEENKDEITPPEEAPKFMQPKRPVLETPLNSEESIPPGTDDSGGANAQNRAQPGEVQDPEASTGEDAGNVNNSEGNAISDTVQPSPYFPRGVYEDAQTVEAFYGRKEKPHIDDPDDPRSGRSRRSGTEVVRRMGLLLAAVLIILSLIFLLVSGRVVLPFF